jgi:hypothetical protein
MLDPEGHKLKTAHNRENSAYLLDKNDIEYEVKNGGAHLIVSHNGLVADFWPGTGKYTIRGTNMYNRGVFNLLKDLNR